MLKERLFGLTNSQGNHGEDVKEYYFYLDNTPTHSYLKYLYKYPQAAFPFADLVETNRRRGRSGFEYELLDTGVFDEDRYFDLFVEYAKALPADERAGQETKTEDRGQQNWPPSRQVKRSARRWRQSRPPACVTDRPVPRLFSSCRLALRGRPFPDGPGRPATLFHNLFAA